MKRFWFGLMALVLGVGVAAADAVPGILVNEVLSKQDSPLEDSIELFNPTDAEVDLSGWFLTDDRTNPKAYRIPDGTKIGAKGFAIFLERDFGAIFKLSGDGDVLYVYSADAAGNLTGYSHGFVFGAAENNVSFGRHVISTGEEHFVAQASRTFGAVNAGPKVGPVVINEIMYNPAAGADEFLELRNLTSAPVKLYDPLHPENPWKISGIGYTIPGNIEIPAKGLLLFVGIDPEGFRSKYLVPAEVQILGPFTGSLSNSGDIIELFKPGEPTTNIAGMVDVPKILVDAVSYKDAAPWPASADGDGPSLERIDGFAYANDPANWRASVAIGGTPGRPAVADTDGDGMNDDIDADDDNDGLTDAMELAAGTNPLDANSKPDGTADFEKDGMLDQNDPDDDNDGVTDANELIDGTNPYDAHSFTRVALDILKVSGTVKFTDGSGKCAMNGTITKLAGGFNPDGAVVKVNMGGAVSTFTLNKTGKGKNELGTFGLTLKRGFAGGPVAFKVAYQKGAFAITWAPLGIDPKKTVKAVPFEMPLELTLAGRVFAGSGSTAYTSVALKGGKFATKKK